MDTPSSFDLVTASDAMEPFPPTQEPDEGYSEYPLNASSVDSSASLSLLRSRLSLTQKKDLAMHLLDDLPTSMIAEIVRNQLNPRLYIDFVEYLPTEICLKIFGFLDPRSLIYVARCCHQWFDLALDRKLWETLYYLEGWLAITAEISAAEARMNAGLTASTDIIHPQRLRSSEFGHTHKKRAVSDPPPQDADADSDMMDLDRDDSNDGDGLRHTETQGASLFGGPSTGGSGSSSSRPGDATQHLGHLMTGTSSHTPETRRAKRVDLKGKGKAIASPYDDDSKSSDLFSIPKSTLWTYDTKDKRYKINWQYLYTMRRRLESNWERGKYTNFQLPHPNHPEEGHQECIYSLQYNSEYLVSGSRDKTLRIWNLQTRRLVRPPLIGHIGSVLCLQFDSDPEEDLIVSGSSDSTVILWKFSTGEIIQRLSKAHRESVLNVKFDKRILVTCSKDRTIKIFNRTPLRAGDVGYGDIGRVSPVPINLRQYGYDESPLDQLPIKPPYTQIGCLEGHGAAVNAVQICGNEIVSASGDRHIKVWDWTTQLCRRTFLGHNKGIACVQYDGRRIVSGSSDNEVKVFDRATGLEVASLKAHSNLVRTVQAGFGDLPYSVEEDQRMAKQVDQEYFKALNEGKLGDAHSARGKANNAGSRRPEDITAYGAKLPPGGGGGPYGRIVSGSYDQTIIIWRRDREGKWRNSQTLRQEDAATAAMRRTPGSSTARISPPSEQHHNPRPLVRLPPHGMASAPPELPQTSNFTHVEHPIHATVTSQTTVSYTRMIDNFVPQGPATLQDALTSFPTMLAYHSHLQAAIDREPDPATRSQLRQVVTTALTSARLTQNRIENSIQRAMASTSSATEPSSQVSSGTASTSASQPTTTNRPSASSSQQTTSRQPTTASVHAAIQAANRPSAITSQLTSSRQTRPSHTASSTATENGSEASTLTASALAALSGPPTVVNGTSQHAQLMQPVPQSQPHAHVSGQPPVVVPVPAPAPVAHHPHIAQADTNPARVFKLQFDSRRIMCCSQTSTIVGWDFCNGDAELEEASRFFGTVE